MPLPLQRGEERRERPPQLGKPEGPRRGKPFLRTTPPTLTMAEMSGSPGPSPWRDHKCPDTRVIHSIPPLHNFSLCRACLCSPPKAGLDDLLIIASTEVNTDEDRAALVAALVEVL